MCGKKDNYVKPYKLNNNKGLTLVEIVLAVTLLGIVAVSFGMVFSGSHKFIYELGDRTKALTLASTALDKLYAVDVAQIADNNRLASLVGASYAANEQDLTKYTPGVNMKIYRTPATPVNGADGCWISVAVFYRNGTQYVTLTSFFKTGG